MPTMKAKSVASGAIWITTRLPATIRLNTSRPR